MISANEIVLCGRRTYHKLFDPGGRSYTSMWIRVNAPGYGIIPDSQMLIEVSINEKQLNGRALQAITGKLDQLQGDAWVLARGQIVNKKDKSGTKKSAFRASLSSLEILDESTPVNDVLVAGDIEQRLPNGLVIGFPYHKPKENKWDKRMIPVTIPSEGEPGFDLIHRNALEKLETAKRVAISGLLRAKDARGNDMVNVYATRIIPIG